MAFLTSQHLPLELYIMVYCRNEKICLLYTSFNPISLLCKSKMFSFVVDLIFIVLLYLSLIHIFAVRLNMLGCACVDMPAGYVESIKAVV